MQYRPYVVYCSKWLENPSGCSVQGPEVTDQWSVVTDEWGKKCINHSTVYAEEVWNSKQAEDRLKGKDHRYLKRLETFRQCWHWYLVRLLDCPRGCLLMTGGAAVSESNPYQPRLKTQKKSLSFLLWNSTTLPMNQPVAEMSVTSSWLHYHKTWSHSPFDSLNYKQIRKETSVSKGYAAFPLSSPPRLFLSL